MPPFSQRRVAPRPSRDHPVPTSSDVSIMGHDKEGHPLPLIQAAHELEDPSVRMENQNKTLPLISSIFSQSTARCGHRALPP